MSKSNSRFRNHLLGGVAALGAVLAGSEALAQDGGDGGTLSEIVVTAQKRAQNIQDVPVAITAITAEAIQTNRVVNIMDLNGLAPGMMARTNAGNLGSPSFSMRGVFASSSTTMSDRQVSTYIDGVYIGSTRGAIFDLPDIQRIEVLRGPQGTLFGRNATAGAVSVVTRDPTGNFAVRQEATLGNYDQFRSRTSIDLPAVGPFSAYITYVHDERRGDTRNLGAGVKFDVSSPFTDHGVEVSPKWLGSKNSDSVFAALRFESLDNFSMVYKFDWSDVDNTPEARAATAINPNSFVGNMLLGVLRAQPAGGGRFGPVTVVPSATRQSAVNNAWARPGHQRNEGHSLTSVWEVNDSLSVKNITAYRKSSVYAPSLAASLAGLEFTAGAVAPYAVFAAASTVPGFGSLPPATQGAIIGQFAAGLTPLVGSYFNVYDSQNYGRGWQMSSETQVNYQSKFVTLTVGGLWYQAKELASGLEGMRSNFVFSPTPSLLPLGAVEESRAKTISLAAYAQGEFHITPQLDLVLGGRVTKDKKRGSLVSGGTFVGTRTNGAIGGAVYTPFDYKKTKPTYSVGVNYKPNDDVLIYGKYSTAFLSGGTVGTLQFAPETVKSAEVGVKSELLDRRLRLNAAAYTATYRHSQSAQAGANAGYPQFTVVVVDNGTLKAKGVEVEALARPTDGLTVGAQVGYTDAKLTNPSPLVIASAGGRYVLPGMPKWIGAVNAQYQTEPVYGDAYLLLRADANYQGKYRSNPNPDVEIIRPALAPYEFIPSRWIINARIALRDINIGAVKGEVALWGRNLTNNDKALYPVTFGDILTGTSFQPARTYGVDLIVNF